MKKASFIRKKRVKDYIRNIIEVRNEEKEQGRMWMEDEEESEKMDSDEWEESSDDALDDLDDDGFDDYDGIEIVYDILTPYGK